MSNAQDTDAEDIELEIIEDPAKGESAVDPQATDDGEGEVDDAALDLEPEEEPEERKVEQLTPAQEQAKRQEDAWFVKVKAGTAKVEDAPKWLQPRLTERLDTTEAPDTEAVVEKVLAKKAAEEAKEQEDRDVKARIAQLPAMTQEQADEFKARLAQLKGANRLAAIDTVIDAMGFRGKLREAEERGIAKGRMSLPRSGQPSVKKPDQQVVGNVPLDVVTDDNKWNEAVRKGHA